MTSRILHCPDEMHYIAHLLSTACSNRVRCSACVSLVYSGICLFLFRMFVIYESLIQFPSKIYRAVNHRSYVRGVSGKL